ncbi:hypothetical protein BC834DRAFT_261510 [Gloeopeniophorella convolvens]|nr:hypothetical protein BC834DRAFT_261510 [Gloeopeniophorella convolvens]
MSSVVALPASLDRVHSRRLPPTPPSETAPLSSNRHFPLSSRPPSLHHGHPDPSEPGPSRLSMPPSSEGIRLRTFSAYKLASSRFSLSSVLQKPRILANFLRYTSWPEFRSLALTCKACRNVLKHPELRDAVLSAFIPGFDYCLRRADLDAYRDIEVRFIDLNHFMASLQLQLHRYPTHALAALSSLWVTPDLEDKTKRYVALSQAHSRMVLLLQALIHSSSSPVPEEPEDPSLRYRGSTQQGGRELVFPAPLSFFSKDADTKGRVSRQPTKKHGRFLSLPAVSTRSPRVLESDAPKRSRSRMSVFGRSRVPLPPPSADPLGLKLYASSWRGWRRALATSGSTSEDDEALFRRPTRRFTSTTPSSRSSMDNSNSSPSPHSSRLSEFVPTPPNVTSPHDIRSAISRLRAPILRVYFPCSELDQDAITACEAQLDDAGLWQHLSIGDVVCNLGYLPPAERQGSSSDLSSDGKPRAESWLLFDGTGLVPYAPTATLPLSEPLSLPSPLYYAHIIPPPVNPQFVAVLPHEEPELSLMLLPARVRSPHSPMALRASKSTCGWHAWAHGLDQRSEKAGNVTGF